MSRLLLINREWLQIVWWGARCAQSDMTGSEHKRIRRQICATRPDGALFDRAQLSDYPLKTDYSLFQIVRSFQLPLMSIAAIAKCLMYRSRFFICWLLLLVIHICTALRRCWTIALSIHLTEAQDVGLPHYSGFIQCLAAYRFSHTESHIVFIFDLTYDRQTSCHYNYLSRYGVRRFQSFWQTQLCFFASSSLPATSPNIESHCAPLWYVLYSQLSFYTTGGLVFFFSISECLYN